jgi:hypothetical protein
MADLREIVLRWPFLASPVHLMQCYRGSAYLPTPKHLWRLNQELVEFFNGPGGEWFVCNMPFRHGKSEISSIGFPAWVILWKPDTRIMICGHGTEFARDRYGAEVKKAIEMFGPELGIKLRADSKAKGRWNIDGKQGGMACFGPEAGGLGYPADLYIIDDLIASIEDAMAPGTSDKHFDFWWGTVFSRMERQSKMALVGTRWGGRDIFARVMDLARKSGKPFRHIRFPALAREGDIDRNTGVDMLGRKTGEPLWPEHVSPEHLEIARKHKGPLFQAAWQQSPTEEEHSLFRPSEWPTYKDMGHAWGLRGAAGMAMLSKQNVSVLVTVDWAYSEKKKADRTAIPVCGLLPNGDLLILNCITGRFAVEQGPAKLAEVCMSARPAVVGMEGHHAMLLECRKYPAIPQPRQLQPRSKAKLVRAVGAIEMGNARRLWLPEDDPPWLDDFKEELGAFTGVDDDKDDIVDALAWACQLAQEFRGASSGCSDPEVLTPAPARFPTTPYMGGLG